MSSIELAYWLMIAGALLVVAGVVGLALSRNKEDEADPVALPGDAPWRGLRSDSPPGSNFEPKKNPQFPITVKPVTRLLMALAISLCINSFAVQWRLLKQSAA